MRIHVHETELAQDSRGRPAGLLISREQGAVKGFCLGISYYDQAEYGTPGIHEDQESFYVLAGTGTAKVGAAEFPIRPGSSFIAAPGVPHTMKRDAASEPIKILWAHGAI